MTSRPNEGPDRVGESKISVAADAQVGIELVWAEVVEAGSRHATRVAAQHSLEEALDKTHGKAPSYNRDEHLGMFRGESSVTASDEPGPAPEPSHPRHSSDTAPKGAETHPGDGCLSVGTASMPFSYIYHVWRRNSDLAEKETEANRRNKPMPSPRGENRAGIEQGPGGLRPTTSFALRKPRTNCRKPSGEIRPAALRPKNLSRFRKIAESVTGTSSLQNR